MSFPIGKIWSLVSRIFSIPQLSIGYKKHIEQKGPISIADSRVDTININTRVDHERKQRLERIVNRPFENMRINLDDKLFELCNFKDCEIVTETGNFGLSGCNFSNCRLTLGPQAFNVALLLQGFFPQANLPFMGQAKEIADKAFRR